MSIRQQLTADLKKALPKGYRLINHQDTVDALSGTLVVLKQQSVTKEPSAPQGTYRFSYVATVVTPNDDLSKAEDSLDDNLADVLFALDGLSYVLWTEAQKVNFNESYLAYDINLSVLTTITKEA